MQPLLAITGILTRASEAKEKTEEAQEKEGLELAVTSSQMEDVNTLEITEEKLSDAIKQQFGNNKDFSITNNGDGSFLVSMNDTQRMYYIDEIGEIIDQSKMLKISTADELKAFRDDVNSGNTYEGWYVYLTNDITLDINEEWDPIGLYQMENSTPDAETNNPFKGIFDGRRYEVDGIYINTTNKVQGLFGLVVNGTIKNTVIGTNCNILGKNVVSGLVGYAYNDVNIKNCVNLTSIHGETNIAGIVGIANSNCIVKNCNNAGTVNATSGTAGGIVGFTLKNTIIQNCQNNGEITSTGANAGGITASASNNSKIYDCFNNNSVTGGYWVGGISGNNDNVYIMNSYNAKNITSTSRVSTGGGTSGISGKSFNSVIENCYNIGEISGVSGNNIGYIAGTSQNGYVRNSYSLDINNINIIGLNNNTHLGEECSLKTSTELKQLYNILGESFKEDTNSINNGYPILQWQ